MKEYEYEKCLAQNKIPVNFTVEQVLVLDVLLKSKRSQLIKRNGKETRYSKVLLNLIYKINGKGEMK